MGDRRLLSLLRGHRMKCLLKRMLDESEFLSDYGIRAISKFHEANPFVLMCEGEVAQCGGRVDGEIRTGRIEFDDVRWQFKLARADLVSHELPVDRIDA